MSAEKSFFRRLSRRMSKSPTPNIPNEPPPAYTERALASHPPPERPRTGDSANSLGFALSPTRSAASASLSARAPATTSPRSSANLFVPTTQVHPPSPDMLHPHRAPASVGYAPAAPPPGSPDHSADPRRPASPTLSVNTRSSQITRQSLSTDDDPYAFLSTFDTSFLIDDSGSMRTVDRGSSVNRWQQASRCIAQIAPIAASHDDDGVDVYFINHKSGMPGSDKTGKAADGYLELGDGGAVQEAFGMARPTGGTLTGKRLRSILQPYLQLLERNRDNLDDVKPLNLIVITDGQAQDDVESVIINAARKLDQLDAAPYQLGVQFFQVGSDRDATAGLKELDDELESRAEVRDIVDTVAAKLNPDGTVAELTSGLILKTVLGSVIKKLDRKSHD